jgi:hypothetical protein
MTNSCGAGEELHLLLTQLGLADWTMVEHEKKLKMYKEYTLWLFNVAMENHCF